MDAWGRGRNEGKKKEDKGRREENQKGKGTRKENYTIIHLTNWKKIWRMDHSCELIYNIF